MSYLLTVIVPVFNRRNSIVKALSSAIQCFQTHSDRVQIIVVDDKSSDDTTVVIKNNFSEFLKSGEIVLIESAINLGVSGARNLGVRHATGDWLLFLDSDDHLIVDQGTKIINQLLSASFYCVVFFRCVDHLGKLVGTNFRSDGCEVNLVDFLKFGSYGEALVAIQRSKIDGDPFIEKLRGYEGLTIARIIKNHGSAYLSAIVARVYDQSGDDRLSSNLNFIARMPELAHGHWLMCKEFSRLLGPQKAFAYLLKAVTYFMVGNLYRLTKRKIR